MDQKLQKSVFEMDISPFRILLWNALAALLFQVVVFFNSTGPGAFLPRTQYTIALSFLMVYSLFTAVLSLASQKPDDYWWKALLSYAILAIGTGVTAYFFSGLLPDEAGPFKWMFLVFSFGFILLLAIFRAMRKLMSMAQKMDNRLPK
ncbi:MAG: hypothetical protein U0V54_13825 [Saprospiraceae bacterium]